MENKYKIYCLIDPRDNHPFYVGATRRLLEQRLASHITQLDRKSKKNSLTDQRKERIKAILDIGKLPIISMIEEANERDAGYLEETHFYRLFKEGYTLLQSASHFTYSLSHYKQPENNDWAKLYISIKYDLNKLLMRQPEIEESRIPRCRVLNMLIIEALNAREAKKNINEH